MCERLCHANNGSGDAEIGTHMYPPAPDMRLSGTQRLTDGELFFVISKRNSPARHAFVGKRHSARRGRVLEIVRFIRRLPLLTAEEEQKMKMLNPRSPQELEEEREEREFLNGDETHEQIHNEQHH
jgi:hypothetical protein